MASLLKRGKNGEELKEVRERDDTMEGGGAGKGISVIDLEKAGKQGGTPIFHLPEAVYRDRLITA